MIDDLVASVWTDIDLWSTGVIPRHFIDKKLLASAASVEALKYIYRQEDNFPDVMTRKEAHIYLNLFKHFYNAEVKI